MTRRLAVAVVVLLVANAAALLTRDEDGGEPVATPSSSSSTTTTVPTTTTTTVPTTTTAAPVPVEIRFSVRIDTDDARLPEVFAMRPDGSGVHRVPGAPPHPLRQVRSDGRVVLSKRIDCRTGTPCPPGRQSTFAETAIVSTASDGSDERILTRGGTDEFPTWSPDGSRILYLSLLRLPGREIEVATIMNADGTGVVHLVPPPDYEDAQPMWAPDGRSIAVLRYGPGNDNVWVTILPLEGGPPQRVAQGDFQALTWSHDGRSFAAAVFRHEAAADGTPSGPVIGSDLWVLPVGGKPRQLTRFARDTAFTHSYCGTSGRVVPLVTSPVWSPDDTRIAFLSSYRHVEEQAVLFDILTIAPDGSGMRTVRPAAKRTCVPLEQETLETTALLGWTP